MRRDYLTDALGSVTAAVNSSGAVENTYRCKPYGDRLAKTGIAADPRFQWTGDTGSRVTGTRAAEQYNQARHYGSTHAAWISVDTLWPDELPYSYLKGAVVTHVDPTGLQSMALIPPRLFCPRKTRTDQIPPCNSTSAGNCPNQVGRGMVDLRKFNRKGNPSDITVCDPTSIDKEAIRLRIATVSKLVDGLCSMPSDSPIPDELGANSYVPYVITRPCWRYTKELGTYVGCNIRCDKGLKELHKYFKNGPPQNGVGCLACYLLAHENFHCMQIVLSGARIRTYGVECAAFKHELQCLTKVFEGKPCS